ncbi:MAG: transcription antitermination factor NusB [Clostridiales bacterium]|nr:transcription antitermination factor NusB [Clostridiales bacterium]
MKRTEARELAFKTIYSRFFNHSEEDILENASLNDLDFTTKILGFFAEHYAEINEKISSNLKGFTLERLNKIDLAILILAVIELDYVKNPKEVVINEAVELAKKYSTEKSPKFINGFLAGLVK